MTKELQKKEKSANKERTEKNFRNKKQEKSFHEKHKKKTKNKKKSFPLTRILLKKNLFETKKKQEKIFRLVIN
jgi:hypothetical protein